MVRTNLKALALATILAAPALARVANPQFAEAGLSVRADEVTTTDDTPTTTEGTTTEGEDKHDDDHHDDDHHDDDHHDDGYGDHDDDHHDDDHHDGGYGNGTDTGSAWSPAPDTCSPSYEEYECEKEGGDWETTTVTVYSSGCPGWHEPTPLPAWESWAPVDPGHPHYPKPTDSWSSYPDHDDHKPHPPPGWYEWDYSWGPKPSTWDEWKYAPATTWSSWDPKPTWSSYPDHGDYYAPEGWYEWDYSKGGKPAHWDDWKHGIKGDDWKQGEYEYQWDNYGKKYVVVTIVEVYKVPCSTGWEDKTTTIYTTHCGCTETPVPKTPEYVTLTTTCPESWGLGKTVVTYSTPTCSWTPDAASTWLTYSVKTPVAADSSSTWATWSGYKTPVAADTTSTWATAAIKTPAAATAQWSGVAKWQGAASSVMISKAMVGGAGMVAALAYFL